MVWMEDNICIYRNGEILHTSAVLVGTIHVIQGIYINWREPAFSSVVCKQKVCLTTRRRMVKETQVVGGTNSTKEGMNKNKYQREVERELFLTVLACETISKRKH